MLESSLLEKSNLPVKKGMQKHNSAAGVRDAANGSSNGCHRGMQAGKRKEEKCHKWGSFMSSNSAGLYMAFSGSGSGQDDTMLIEEAVDGVVIANMEGKIAYRLLGIFRGYTMKIVWSLCKEFAESCESAILYLGVEVMLVKSCYVPGFLFTTEGYRRAENLIKEVLTCLGTSAWNRRFWLQKMCRRQFCSCFWRKHLEKVVLSFQGSVDTKEWVPRTTKSRRVCLFHTWTTRPIGPHGCILEVHFHAMQYK